MASSHNFEITENVTNLWNSSTHVTFLFEGTPNDLPIVKALSVTVSVIVSFMIISSNIMNVAVLRVTKQIPLISRLCLLNLSVADLSVGFISCLPCIVPAVIGRWPYGDIWCQIAGIFHGMSVTMSIWSLALVSIDRYIAIKYPLTYGTRVTPVRLKILLVLLWMISFLTFSIPLPTKSNFVYYQFSSAEIMCGLYWEYPWFCLVTAVYIPILSGSILLFTTVSVSREVVKMAQNPSNPTISTGISSIKKSELKPVRVLIVTSAIYFLAWGPYVIEVMVLSAASSLDIPAYVRFTTIWIANSNSFMNVFVYSVMYTSFRNNLFRLFASCLGIKTAQIAPESTINSHNVYQEHAC